MTVLDLFNGNSINKVFKVPWLTVSALLLCGVKMLAGADGAGQSPRAVSLPKRCAINSCSLDPAFPKWLVLSREIETSTNFHVAGGDLWVVYGMQREALGLPAGGWHLLLEVLCVTMALRVLGAPQQLCAHVCHGADGTWALKATCS